MRFVPLIGLLLCSLSNEAQQTTTVLKTNVDNNSLLWEISGKGLAKPSYLYGTFHLLCKDDIHISETCKQAIVNSEEVYLELDLDDPSTLMQGMMLMNMKNGKKIKDLYSAEAYQRVVQFFSDSLNTPIGMLQNMKPFFLMALLYPKMMPCNDISGIDQAIMNIAQAQGKEIKGLETMAMQASVFDSIPYEKQAEELLQSIDSMDKARQYFAVMVKAYKSQQLVDIEKLMNDTAYGMQENHEVLLDKRNLNWVQQLRTIMKAKPVFVAVGAGHLIGEQGLIALLKKEGYVLRPLANK